MEKLDVFLGCSILKKSIENMLLKEKKLLGGEEIKKKNFFTACCLLFTSRTRKYKAEANSNGQKIVV